MESFDHRGESLRVSPPPPLFSPEQVAEIRRLAREELTSQAAPPAESPQRTWRLPTPNCADIGLYHWPVTVNGEPLVLKVPFNSELLRYPGDGVERIFHGEVQLRLREECRRRWGEGDLFQQSPDAFQYRVTAR